LRVNYTYTTTITTPPPGVDRVEWFLFQGKQGYCEYYASSMIIMLRHLGIPSRLAGGYAPGTLDPVTGKYVVKESSAHAWPEVYFPQYGWINFEPTPSQAVITHEEPKSGATEVPTPAPTDDGPTPSPTDGAIDKTLRPPSNPPNVGSGGFSIPGGAAGGLLIAGAVAAVIALLFFMPFSPFGKRRSAASAKFYYGRMLFWSRLLRAGPSPHQTPFEYSEALAREVPGSGLYARTIARAYVRERFSRNPLELHERRTLRDAYDSLRARLWRNVPGRQVRRVSRRGRARK